MPQRVRLPDGRVVVVPDDATPAQISAMRAKLSQEFPDAAPKLREGPATTRQPAVTEEQRKLAREAGRKAVSGRGGRATAAGLGLGGGAFEAANLFLRHQIKRDLGVNDEQAKILADEALGAAARERPAAFTAGYGTSAALSGGAAAKGLGLVGKAGQPVLNTAKTAILGAGEAAAAALGRGEKAEDVARQAAAGGALSPAVSGVLRKASQFVDLPGVGEKAQAGFRALARGEKAEDVARQAAAGGALSPAVSGVLRKASQFVDLLGAGEAQAGFRALARAAKRRGIDVTPDQLRKTADEFRRVTGRPASPQELLGERLSREATDIVQKRGDTRPIVEGAKKVTQNLQEGLVRGVTRGKVVPSVTKLDRFRKLAADKAMGAIQDRPVKFDTGSVKELVEDRAVYRALPDEEKLALLEMTESGGELTVRQVENIRQAFRQRGAGVGGARAKLREFADGLVEGAEDQVPEYGRYLKSFARRSKGIRGVEAGRKVLSREDTTEFAAEVADLSKPALGGARAGARAGLVDEARKGPRQAAELARSLSEDVGVEQRLAALDPEEAARLRDVGRVETKALESVRGSLETIRNPTLTEQEHQLMGEALEASFALSGRGYVGMLERLGRKISDRFGVPPTAAKRLAEALTDPAKTDEVINLMRRYDIDVEEVINQYRTVATRAAAQQTTGREQQ